MDTRNKMEPAIIEPVSTNIPRESLSYVPEPNQFKKTETFSSFTSPTLSRKVDITFKEYRYTLIDFISISGGDVNQTGGDTNFTVIHKVMKNDVIIAIYSYDYVFGAVPPTTQPQINASWTFTSPLLIEKTDTLSIELEVTNDNGFDAVYSCDLDIIGTGHSF